MDSRTIVYVGNFTRPWCTEVHLAASLEALGHQVVRVQEKPNDGTDWAGVPTLADDAGAHMLLWTRTHAAEMATVRPVLAELRARGVPSVAYHLDLFLGLDREHQVTDQPFFACDLLVTPHRSERWGELGVNHLWQPPGVFHAETDAIAPDKRAYPWDVVFVGSHPYPHPEWEPTRTALIEAFEAEFGSRFAVLPAGPKGHRRPLRGADLQRLYATVPVVLGDSCLAGQVEGYWSDRVPETLGRGGLLLHPEVGDDIGPLGVWYDNSDLLTYKAGDPQTAVGQAFDMLKRPNESRLIAEQGRATVLGRDTYVHRMATMLQHVEEQFGWREPPPPPPVPRPPMRAQLHRWRAQFEPRAGDVGAIDVSVIDEVWKANDYRVPPAGFKGTVVDLGGNVGAFAVLAAKAGAAKVVSFEPHPENRARLHHHVTLNGYEDPRIQIQPLAVVRDPARHPVVELAGMGGGVYIDPESDEIPENDESVPTESLAVILKRYAPIEFLKVDIEGGEYDAFAGVTAHELDESVAAIALEFHGPHMPHLPHLDDDGGHVARWGALVALLADCGHLEIHGHPSVGGLMFWRRF